MRDLLITIGLILSAQSAMATSVERTCLFGEDIGEISENPRLSVKSDVLKTLKIDRTANVGDANVIAVSVTVIKDKKTKRVFHMNTTFLHRDDGDNTFGWIEEVTTAFEDNGEGASGRAVVAEIGDSSIDVCRVFE
jgi:hypothetical protein